VSRKRTLTAVLVQQQETRLGIAQRRQDRAGDALAEATTEKYRAMPYEQYLRTVHWRAFRARILKDRDRTCEECGERYGLIDVHHLTYENLGCERDRDVVVLCRECHEKEHGNGTN
jgi:hypothetical protein